jgi:hypothetical protein
MANKEIQSPKQFMCIDGKMHIVEAGQFVFVHDYNNLLKRYKKLLKLCRINGLFDSIKKTKEKVQRIFGDNV